MIFNANGVAVDIEDVIEIAAKAAAAIKDVYSTDVEIWNNKFKDDETPLTKAQEISTKILEEELRSKYPSIPILAESIKLSIDDRLSSHFFCVSPLDGYKDFVRRNGQFSVSIGLCEQHEPVLGVIYVPCSTLSPPRVYYAVERCGAYVRPLVAPEHPHSRTSENTDNSEGKSMIPALSIITPTRLEAQAFYESDSQLRILAHTPSFGADSMKAFLGSYIAPDVDSTPGYSLLSLMQIAEGKAHILPRMASTCEWNTCAAHAIINESGGEILQVAGGAVAATGSQLEYNKPMPLNPHFIAYGKRLLVSPATSPSGALSHPPMRGVFSVIDQVGSPTGSNNVSAISGYLSSTASRISSNSTTVRGKNGKVSMRNTQSKLASFSDSDGTLSDAEVTDDPEQVLVSIPSASTNDGTMKKSPSRTQKRSPDSSFQHRHTAGNFAENNDRQSVSSDDDEEDDGDDDDDDDDLFAKQHDKSSLYSSMMFSFLVASFVVLVGWVLLPSVDSV